MIIMTDIVRDGQLDSTELIIFFTNQDKAGWISQEEDVKQELYSRKETQITTAN